jgi:hypothetical protein
MLRIMLRIFSLDVQTWNVELINLRLTCIIDGRLILYMTSHCCALHIFVHLHVDWNPELLAHFHILTVILDIDYAWNMTTVGSNRADGHLYTAFICALLNSVLLYITSGFLNSWPSSAHFWCRGQISNGRLLHII